MSAPTTVGLPDGVVMSGLILPFVAGRRCRQWTVSVPADRGVTGLARFHRNGTACVNHTMFVCLIRKATAPWLAFTLENRKNDMAITSVMDREQAAEAF